MIKWCLNGKIGEIFSYEVSGNLTDFPRGTLMAYDDYLVTGISSNDEAVELSKEYGVCHKCRSTMLSIGMKCHYCNGKLEKIILKGGV